MKELTQREFASMGGLKRAKNLSKARRKEIASNAGKANKGKKRAKYRVRKQLSTPL